MLPSKALFDIIFFMKRMLSFALIALILLSFSPFAFSDGYSKLDKTEVSVYIDGQWKNVRALTASYDNNVYISCRSLAEALNGTPASFDFHYDYTANDGTFFSITTSSPYTVLEIKDDADAGYIELKRNRLFVDGQERRYYSYRFGDPEDLYFSVLDLCFIFNTNISLVSKGAYFFQTGVPFSADLEELDKSGFFDNCSCVLSGSAKTGNIYFSKNAQNSLAVASTTKLMTYLLVMDAVSTGITTLDTQVVLSDNVQKMSESENGLIPMEQGQTPTVSELLNALLVASSNEAAIALAEHVYGSESSFVTQMNRKARSLNLKDSRYYNCSGLPFYTESIYGIKKQNYMSGNDLFVLTSYILNTYPSITEITSQQFAYFPTFDYNTANSNSLVFNIDSCTGLKTGNTNQAGCCVVACNSSSDIIIVLGAEDNSSRGQIAEILFRCTS